MTMIALLFSLLFIGLQCFSIHINPEVNSEIIHSLDDTNFDFYIQEGRNYQWLVMIYTNKCENCNVARGEMQRVFAQINHEDIRFAEIDHDSNPLTSTRFEVNGFPYILMIYKERMWRNHYGIYYSNLMKFLNNYQRASIGSMLPPKMKLYYFMMYNFYQYLIKYNDITLALIKIFGFKIDNIILFQIGLHFIFFFACILLLQKLLQCLLNKLPSNLLEEETEQE